MPDDVWSAWGPPAKPAAQLRLRFDAVHEKILNNFSAGARAGDTLFVAADEHAAVNRLIREGDEWVEQGAHELSDLLPEMRAGEEADIEALAAADGWLWVAGSHARTRRKPEKQPGETIDLDRLADLKDTQSRCLLARIPLVENHGGWTLAPEDGARRAGMIEPSDDGNALRDLLKRDPLLAPFTDIPAKEGGVDIEGIAICGDRVALGMRGPVVAGYAVLLEFGIGARKSGALDIASPPVKRLLALEGLGIRDLERCGDDLLILAGPTTALSGPCALYRWRDWAKDRPRDAHLVRVHRPERLLELPFGRGVDHPEGLALWNGAEPGARHILVLYDSPGPARIGDDGQTIVADIFAFPE